MSDEALQDRADALGGDYDLLFNGIEVERFAKATPATTDGPTIVFVGRHEDRKGLAVLLEAMATLPADVRLWVAGEGPQTDELRAAYGDDPRIEWLGRVDDDEKAALLRGADVFCAPSLHGESFGVVLLEAMAARRRSWPATSTGTATSPATGPTRCWCRRATPPRWPRRWPESSATAPRRGASSHPARRGPSSSR